MGAFSGYYIDSAKVKALASEGLCVTKIANILGHSRTGIKMLCDRHGIDTVDGKYKNIIVDGVEMSAGAACKLKGFTREAMYQYRVNRGLDLQDGFDAYVLYMQTKQATQTVSSKNIMLLFRRKLQTLTVIKNILGLGECFLMFMRNNDYKQQAFDRYLYMKGLK